MAFAVWKLQIGIKQLFSKLPKHWKKLTITGVGPDRKTYVRDAKITLLSLGVMKYTYIHTVRNIIR